MFLSRCDKISFFLFTTMIFSSGIVFADDHEDRVMEKVRECINLSQDVIEKFENMLVKDDVTRDPWFNEMVGYHRGRFKATVQTIVTGTVLRELKENKGKNTSIDGNYIPTLTDRVISNEMPKEAQRMLVRPRNSKKMPVLIASIKEILSRRYDPKLYQVALKKSQLEKLERIKSFADVYLLLKPMQLAFVMNDFCRPDDRTMRAEVQTKLKEFIVKTTGKEEHEAQAIVAQSFDYAALTCAKNDIKNSSDFQNVKVGVEAKSKYKSVRFIASFVAASLAYLSWAYHGSYDNIGTIFTGIFGVASLYEAYDFIKTGRQQVQFDSYIAKEKEAEETRSNIDFINHDFDDIQWILHEKDLQEPIYF